jgi:hypothetical protein
MRKITILEVLDPVKNEFVPLKQAINQGLFNPRTYLFFNPVESKHYSITEAAHRGLFKSAIDLQPESLIIERVKVAETVSLISARDPENKNRILNIYDAIRAEIVDTNLKIYRNPVTNEIKSISDAIDEDLIQVKVVREITEKVTETLTEQKTPENLGLIKKIASSSTSQRAEDEFNINYEKYESQEDLDEQASSDSLKRINGMYVFDRTKSLNVNKRLKVYEGEFAAGFITDSDSKKILNQSSKKLKSILKSDTKLSSPIIDFNEAVRKNIIILPDSVALTQNVKYVVDLKTGNSVSFDVACQSGIIDVKKKLFCDTRSNTTMTLFEALNKNYIVMKEQLDKNYEDEENEQMNGVTRDVNGSISNGTKNALTIAEISKVFDPSTGEQIAVDRAIQLGLLDRRTNSYVDMYTRRFLSLEEAVDKGMAVLKPDSLFNKEDAEFEFLNIIGIYNPLTGVEMPLNEAIEAGFIDYTECEFHDPKSGKTLTLLDAYDKGLLITKISYVNKSNRSLPLPQPPQVKQIESRDVNVQPRGRRANDYERITATTQANSSANSNMSREEMFRNYMSEPITSGAENGFKIKRNNNNSDTNRAPLRVERSLPVSSAPPFASTPEYAETPTLVTSSRLPTAVTAGTETPTATVKTIQSQQPRAPLIRSQTSVGSDSEHQARRLNMSSRSLTIQSESTLKSDKRDTSINSKVSLKSDSKSESRLSVASKRTFMFKLKKKLLGTKMKVTRLEEEDIFTHTYIVDLLRNEAFSMQEAIENNMILPNYKIRDTETGDECSTEEAIKRQIMRFHFSTNNLEFIYGENCYIFVRDLYLFLHILDPIDHKKLTMREAFKKVTIDEQNGFYFGKRGLYPLDVAIEKGYVSAILVNVDLITSVISMKNFNFKKAPLTRSVTEMQPSVSPSSSKPRLTSSRSMNESEPSLARQRSTITTRTTAASTSASQEPPPQSQSIDNAEVEVTTSQRNVTTVRTQQHTTTITRTTSLEQQPTNMPNSQAPKSLPIRNRLATLYSQDENEMATTSTRLLRAPATVPRAEADSLNSSIASTTNRNIYLPLFDNEDNLNKEILKEAGYNFDPDKNYFISQVYDSEKNTFVSFKKALNIGLFNLEKQEYIDSSNGEALNVRLAIRKNLIKVKPVQVKMKMLRQENVNEFERSMASDRAIYKSTDSIREVPSKSTITALDRKQVANNSESNLTNVDYDHFRPETMSTSTLKNAPRLKSVEPIDLSTSGLSESANMNSIDLIKSLLYKKPKGNKYWRIDKVIRSKLYDTKSGKVKDVSANEMCSLYEALKRGRMLINNPNVLYDSKNFYIIENILSNGGKIPLSEAIESELVDAQECQYKYLSIEMGIGDAMKEGYIEGKLITAAELRSLLEDYARRVEITAGEENESNVSLHRSIVNGLDDFDLSEERKPVEKMIEITEEDLTALESFYEFYIFDPQSEQYITVKEAFYKSLILNEPIRIMDPQSGKYALLKDAVIKGLVSCEKSQGKVDFKDRSTFYTYDRKSYIIDAIYDPRRKQRYSLQEANKKGYFVNGYYKNPTNRTEAHKIDEAIDMGLIVGKRVELDKIDTSFKKLLSNPPTKPSRGVYANNLSNRMMTKSIDDLKLTNSMNTMSNSNADLLSTASKDELRSTRRRSVGSQISKMTIVSKENAKPSTGKVKLIKDVANDRFIKANEAERAGLIDFLKDSFTNSATNEVLKIGKAIESGYIIMDIDALSESAPKAKPNKRDQSWPEKSVLSFAVDKSNSRSKSFNESEYNDDDDDESDNSGNRIKIGRQFEIISVVDPLNRLEMTLDNAIKRGIFDMGRRMYNDLKSKRSISMIEAIDQGLIKITDRSFRTSAKITVEEDDERKIVAVRYVVDSLTQNLIPVNVAVDKGILNIERSVLFDFERSINLRDAYSNHLAFTTNDLDDPESRRAKFLVQYARKTTTGKKMSVRSALAKNWLNIDRRVYIDKQTNTEMPFSQALDLDLLMLKRSIGPNMLNKFENDELNQSPIFPKRNKN